MSAERVTQLIEAGLWLRMSGDVEGARRLFEQALRLDPQNVQAKQLLNAPARPAAGLSSSGPLPREFSHTPLPAAPANSFRTQDAPRDRLPSPVPSIPPLGTRPRNLPPIPTITPMAPRPRPAPPPPARAQGSANTMPFGYGEAPPAPPNAWDSGGKPGFNLTPSPDNGRDAVELLKQENLPVPYSRTPPPSAAGVQRGEEVRGLLRMATEQMGLDNHSGALEIALKAQLLDPDNADVERMREKSERTLQGMYESKLGNLNALPRVLMKDDEVIWLNLDHRAGFVLAQIDGQVSFEDLFVVSGMSRLDTARILVQLKDEGVIG